MPLLLLSLEEVAPPWAVTERARNAVSSTESLSKRGILHPKPSQSAAKPLTALPLGEPGRSAVHTFFTHSITAFLIIQILTIYIRDDILSFRMTGRCYKPNVDRSEVKYANYYSKNMS